MLRLVFEGVREYGGFHKNRSLCWLRVFAERGRPAVVIATELDDNPGTSITYRAEDLATLMLAALWAEHRTDPSEIVWVEHYHGDPRGTTEYTRHDRYSLVEFDFDPARGRFIRPRWTHLTRDRVDLLVGGGPIGEAPTTSTGARPSPTMTRHQPSTN